MAVVLLDTTVLIDVPRGRPAVGRLSDLRRRGDAPVVCAVNVEEVVRGLRPPEVAAAERFLRGLPVVPLAREGARAGAWRRDHAARGITLSQSDCLVAAAAARAGGRLAPVTRGTSPCPS